MNIKTLSESFDFKFTKTRNVKSPSKAWEAARN